MITFAWLLEIVFESFGAFLNFRRSKLLCALLAFCAATDFFAVPFAQYFPSLIHGWIAWGQFAIKELFLIWLACSICGMFVAERSKSQATFAAGFISMGTIAMVIVVGFSSETLKNALLDGEIAANFILLGIVALAWMTRREKLDSAWKWITAGFMLMVGSDLFFTALWTVWDGARHLYPLGAITAQLVWVIGPLKTVKLSEIRASLPKKYLEVEKVQVM